MKYDKTPKPPRKQAMSYKMFIDMVEDDSLFVVCTKKDHQRIRSALTTATRKSGKKYFTKRWQEHENVGLRVWRWE